MLETLLNLAPIVGLLFFFSIFVSIAIWVMRPSARQRFESYAHIPLKEKFDVRQ